MLLDGDATPFARALATRIRIALRTETGRRALDALTGAVDLRSAIDAQAAQLRRTPEGVAVVDVDGRGDHSITVQPMTFDVVGADLPPALHDAVVALIEPEPADLDIAAQRFWELAMDLPGMPGVRLSAVDTGAEVVLGPDTGRYEIFGSELDLRRVLTGMDWFPHALRAGRFAIRGSQRQLSVVIGASTKAVYDV
ncbi:hypothetical protein [Nocardia sp. NPDC059239]|uniref:hypothetical protein n=1 Tax=unclassified Nocardia TaxID=2637762 RepID=UPI0036822D7A